VRPGRVIQVQHRQVLCLTANDGNLGAAGFRSHKCPEKQGRWTGEIAANQKVFAPGDLFVFGEMVLCQNSVTADR
jgi:hypothetical protein